MNYVNYDPHRKEKIRKYIVAFYEENGVSPTVRRVMKFCKFSSPRAAQYWIDKLVDEGYFKKNGLRGLVPIYIQNPKGE